MYAPHPHPQDGVPAGGSFLASPDHSSRRRAKSKGELYSIVTTYLKLLPLFLVKDRQEMEILCCPCVHTNIFYLLQNHPIPLHRFSPYFGGQSLHVTIVPTGDPV